MDIECNLDDVWIVAPSGIPMFARSREKRVADSLFTSFMTALNSIALQIGANGISNFKIGSKRFICMERDGVNFIANHDSDIKEKKAERELESIADRFLSQYASIIPTWDGDVSMFDGFKIDHPGNDVTEKFQQAFW